METNHTPDKTGGISGFVLKMTAVVTMLVDHIAASPLEQYLVANGMADFSHGLFYVYLLMRTIGRMAFPIYLYLLVEGFYHTRSRAKYALRLLIFAVISEVPFDMALMASFSDLSHNNVFFTLLISLLTIWGMDEAAKRFAAEERDSGETVPPAEQIPFGRKKISLKGKLLQILIFLAGCAGAELMHTDYSAGGVIAAVLIYLFWNRGWVSGAIGVCSLGISSGIIEFAALLILPLLIFYNGKRGPQIKYFFYLFYPVHLLILGLICYTAGFWH